jgi:hypothetical protein
MPFSLSDFKAAFGKKPDTAETPRDRLQRLLQTYKPRIDAAVKRGDATAVDLWDKIKNAVAAKDVETAIYALNEAALLLPADASRQDQLQKDFDALDARWKQQPNLPAPLRKEATDLRLAYDKAVFDARYDDAAKHLDVSKKRIASFELARNKFEADWPKLQRSVLGIEARTAGGKPFEGHPKAAELRGTLNKLLRGVADVPAALRGRSDWNYDLVNKDTLPLLTAQADQILQALDAAAPTGTPKAIFEARYATEGKLLEKWETRIKAQPQMAPVLKPAAAAVLKLLDDIRKAAAGADHAAGLALLDKSVDVVLRLRELADAELRAAQARILPKNVMVAKTLERLRKENALAPVQKAVDIAAMEKARGEYVNLDQGADRDLIGALTQYLRHEPIFWQLVSYFEEGPNAAQRQDPKKAGPAYKKLLDDGDRKAFSAAMNNPDANPAALMSVPGARDLLDQMVAGIGSKAASKDDREFLQAAIKARFGLREVTGGEDGKGMSSKALPRLYEVMKDLPESHVLSNELIQSIERQKGVDTSTHNPRTRKIVLKAGESGKRGGNFDDTTLHEVGHGVDAKFGFMTSRGESLPFGGWKQESLETTRRVAGEDLGFYAEFKKKGVSENLLEAYLTAILGGKDPHTLKGQFEVANGSDAKTFVASLDNDPGVQHAAAEYAKLTAKEDTDLQRDIFFAARKKIALKGAERRAIAEAVVKAVSEGAEVKHAIAQATQALTTKEKLPADAVWDEMAQHAATAFSANAYMKPGDSGLWQQGDGGADKYAVNGRVYQEAYRGTWVSYALPARATKVSDYQFRHSMEWFSECYSRYWLGTLSPQHPLAKWLETQKAAAPTKS